VKEKRTNGCNDSGLQKKQTTEREKRGGNYLETFKTQGGGYGKQHGQGIIGRGKQKKHDVFRQNTHTKKGGLEWMGATKGVNSQVWLKGGEDLTKSTKRKDNKGQEGRKKRKEA